MTVLDANAVIAALRREPAAEQVEALFRAAGAAPKLSAVNLAEVVDRLVRVWRQPFDDVLESVIWLGAGGLEVIDADFEVGALAGFLRARHYHRRDNDVSIADCFALATASVLEEGLATSDEAVARVARDENIELIPLPNSTGRQPS